MVVKITWLDTADSYVVKLKNKGDSFECALCNSDGRVHSPTRYLCNIKPSKLKWHTVKLQEPIVIKKTKQKELSEEKNTDNELKERFNNWAADGKTQTMLANEIGFSTSTISNIKNGRNVSNEIAEAVNSYLEKQGY